MAFAHPEPLSSDTPPSSPDQLPERTRRTSRSQPPSKRHTRVTSTDDARRTTDYGDEDSHSRAHRSHHRSTSSSRFIARVLTQETDDARKMSSLLLIANERLESETRRANDAERRALDLISRFREAIQSRDTVAQDSARLREELSLYKLQLDNAQREIFRAQETIQTVAREKQEAESDAARSRSQARALMEEKAVMLAREEGRRSGFREGLERGRLMGVAETRRDVVDDRYSDEDSLEIVVEDEPRPLSRRARSPSEPHRPVATPFPARPPSNPRPRTQSQVSRTQPFRTYDTAQHAPRLPIPTVVTPMSSLPSVAHARRAPTRPPSRSRNPISVEVAAPEHSPESIRPINASTPSLTLPFRESSNFPPGPSNLNPNAGSRSNDAPIRPISVYNAPVTPTPHSGRVLEDGYIPFTDDRTSLFSLPPPHELTAPVPSAPPTPGPSYAPDRALSTPKQRDYAYAAAPGPIRPPYQANIAPLNVMRTASSASRGSTHLSDYDLVSPPRGATPGRTREEERRENEVSPTQRIIEEWRSANPSPAIMPVPNPAYPFPRPNTGASGRKVEDPRRDAEDYERSNHSEHDGAREYDDRRRGLSPGPSHSSQGNIYPGQEQQGRDPANNRPSRTTGGPRRPSGAPVQPSTSSSQSDLEREREKDRIAQGGQAGRAGRARSPEGRSKSPLNWLFRRNRGYSSPTVPNINIEPPSGTPSAHSITTLGRPNAHLLSPEDAQHELPLPGDDELEEFLDDNPDLVAPPGPPRANFTRAKSPQIYKMPTQPSQHQQHYDYFMQGHDNTNELPMGFVPLAGPTVTVMHMSSSSPPPVTPRRSHTPHSKSKLGHSHSQSEGYTPATAPSGVSFPEPVPTRPTFEVERPESRAARAGRTRAGSMSTFATSATGTSDGDSRRRRLMSMTGPSPASLARPISIFSNSS